MPCFRLRSPLGPGILINHSLEFFAVAVLGLIFANFCEGQQPPKPTSKPTFWIVFDYNPEFSLATVHQLETDVYLMDQYGEHVKRLTSDHRSHHPSWSPQGNQIVFLQNAPIQERKGTYDTPDAIYSLLVSRDVLQMDASGHNFARVSSVGPDAQDVAWLPDGKRVVVRISNHRNLQVFIGPPDSSGSKFQREETFEELLQEGHAAGAKWRYWPRLTEFFPPVNNFLPVFYASWTGGPLEVTTENFRRIHTFIADKEAFAKVMDLEGEPSSILAPTFDATWSLDGKWVTFSEFSDDGHAKLFVANIRDNEMDNRSAITDESLEAHGPGWSADASRVAFVGLWRNSSQIFIVNRDGTGLIQVSHIPEMSCTHPSWSPDGKWIVAECGPKITASSPFEDLYGGAWSNDVALFQVSKPGRKPKRLTHCNPLADSYDASSGPPYFGGPPHNDGSPYCRAHNPSFAPAPLAVP